MYSYLFDPPDPNFQLSFVKVGPPIICAFLLKFCPKPYIISFMTYLATQLLKKQTVQKKTKAQLYKKSGGGVQGGMIMITDLMAIFGLLLPFGRG